MIRYSQGRRAVFCLAAIGAAGLLGWQVLGGAQEAAAPARAARVAVVDMGKVFRQSQQWRDLAEERARMADNMKRTLDKLARQVQTLANEYENLPPGTEQRNAKALEIQRAEAELRRTEQEMKERLARHHNDAFRALYANLSQAAAAHAAENGIELVLKKQDFSSPDMNAPEMGVLMATSDVLYAALALDITDAVVARLNAQYAGPLETK